MKSRKHLIKKIVTLVLVLGAINVLASFFFKRLDLTDNQRYTLSKPTKEIITPIDKPIQIKVFLTGDFPSNFRRLKNETRYLLEEFKAYNRDIRFKFINPLDQNKKDAETIGQQFFESGMPPRRLNEKKNGKDSQSLIFPWAVARYGDKTVKIPLLKQRPDDSEDELVNNSVQNLEYAFANAFKQLTTKKDKKIAIMRGNGELPDINLASFLKSIGNYYHTAPFTLDSVEKNPKSTLKKLEDYDLIVEAKPTRPFTKKQKYALDQYLMKGGKSLWLVEAVAAEKDSLFNNNQNQMLAYPRDLKLTNFFFKYGIRLKPALVSDLHADNLILASGHGKQTRFKPYPWYYTPLVVPDSSTANPVTDNIDPVRFDFANPMDTLKNGVNKTVLLKSSLATRVEGTPKQINLNIINQDPDFKTYAAGPQSLAVLLEGRFTSVYKNRVKPFNLKDHKDQSKKTKMIVVSDGDVIKNKVENGNPASLAYDQHTGKSYGNQEFLLNAINYMLDDSGLLDIRTKKVALPFLNPTKTAEQRLFWQIINIGIPLIMLGIFGAGFTFYRRKKYKTPRK